MVIIRLIRNSHTLAKELLSRQDNFITATIENREYIVEGIKTVKTHANNDDSFTYYTLILKNCDERK